MSSQQEENVSLLAVWTAAKDNHWNEDKSDL